MDAYLAAFAMTAGLTLVTTDAGFTRFKDLKGDGAETDMTDEPPATRTLWLQLASSRWLRRTCKWKNKPHRSAEILRCDCLLRRFAPLSLRFEFQPGFG